MKRSLAVLPGRREGGQGELTKSDMDIEGVDISRSPFRLEYLRSDGITPCPSDVGHGVGDAPLGLSSAVSAKHEEDTGVTLTVLSSVTVRCL